jgi:peptidoglycan/xylan/chitin deacetylase (PgdA/CDA1 family)
MALTIDTEYGDAPGRPDNAERLLQALAREAAVASFFLQGRWTAAHPQTAAAIAGAGHLVGNHSNWHVRMPLLTNQGLVEDVRTAERSIAAAAGADPRPYFRCPYGDGHDDPRVLEGLGRLGYRHVHWHVDAHDWEAGQTADGILERVLAGARRQGDGAVILLHSWPDATADALPRLIDGLRGDGAELVRLDQVAA